MHVSQFKSVLNANFEIIEILRHSEGIKDTSLTYSLNTNTYNGV